MPYQKKTGKTVWVVKFKFGKPEVWDTEAHAYEDAYHSVLEATSQEEEEAFFVSRGYDTASASQEEVIEWYNNMNPNSRITIDRCDILTK